MFSRKETIEVGTLVCAQVTLSNLRAGGFQVGDWAEDMLSHPDFPWLHTRGRITVIEATGEELGFKEKVSYGSICNRFVDMGYKLCPPETGPVWRMKYTDQPENNWVMLAMNPVLDLVGHQSIFFLGRGSGGLWLGASRGHPDVMVSAKNRFAACVY